MRSRLVRGGGGASGLLVIDGRDGKAVCARAPGQPAPAGLEHEAVHDRDRAGPTGGESTITTLLKTDGGIDRNGVLHGSLYLVGGGDPTLGTPSFYRRFLGGLGTNIFQLKRQVREAGIKSVTGRLYADDSVFDRLRGVADSGYATSSEIGPLSGLSFNSGYSTRPASSFATDPALTAAGTLGLALRQAGVRISPSVALGTAPPVQHRTRPGRIAAADRASSTPPTSTRTTSSPRC